MNVTVRDVTIVGEMTFVLLESTEGKLRAQWHGATPVQGGQYFVELDCDDELAWGKNFIVSDVASTSIRSVGEEHLIVVKIENLLDNELLIAVLGESRMILKYTGQLPPIGTLIQVSTRSMHASDCCH